MALRLGPIHPHSDKTGIEKLAESSGNVIGFKVSGVVTKADYHVMVPEVEQMIREHGSIRMLSGKRRTSGAKRSDSVGARPAL